MPDNYVDRMTKQDAPIREHYETAIVVSDDGTVEVGSMVDLPHVKKEKE